MTSVVHVCMFVCTYVRVCWGGGILSDINQTVFVRLRVWRFMSHSPIHSGTKVLDVQMSGDKIRFTVMFVSLSETGQSL